MGQKLTAGMPDDLTISGDYQIVFAAVDPTTGADVSGVVISNVNVTADDVLGGTGGQNLGPFMLVPGVNA